MWKSTTLTSWGRSCHATVAAARPERLANLVAAVRSERPGGLIAYGNGRSYGDAPLNHGGQALLTGRLDRLLSFDEASGTLVCEPGVTFRDLLRTFLRRGFEPPVTPGTAYASIGGAIANDVHGKNHERVGSFGDHLLWFDLMLPDSEIMRVSPERQPRLFAATLGGVGLTGVIVKACFRMASLPSTGVALQERRMPDLDAFFDGFEAARATSAFSVGWVDGLAGGRSLGRGILETAEFAPAETDGRSAGRGWPVPFDLPRLALNPLSVSLFNQLYYHRIPKAGRTRLLPLERFYYPLDALQDWNRIYGRDGFFQFQCVIPDAEARRGVRGLLETVAGARASSFLAVIKTLGRAGRGYLSFPMRGYTLALDFPRRPGVEDLLARLERIALDHGGRVYLAKDAVLSADGFQRMYPRLDDMRAVLEEIDPAGRFQSDLARRLRIRTSSQ